MTIESIIALLGEEADSLLTHACEKIPAEQIIVPSSTHVDTVFTQSNRSPEVISQLRRLYGHGRLANTGYLSIFPVDQAMEHTAAYSFYQNQTYFDPESIIAMAVEGGCNAVASTAGALGILSKKYASQIPFIVKINHSEHLTLPEITDQIIFSSVKQASEMGAVGIGATIYFGSEKSHRQIQEISALFETAHQFGLCTILWCYPRNNEYSSNGSNYEDAIDVTAQAVHIGATLGADIIKQKMPTAHHAFQQLAFSKYVPEMYEKLLTDHPIDLVRYQVAHSFMGRLSLINSGGESGGVNDLKDAVRAAVINKRAGGAGLIMGRKIFKRSKQEGIEILNAVQDVYLAPEITVA